MMPATDKCPICGGDYKYNIKAPFDTEYRDIVVCSDCNSNKMVLYDLLKKESPKNIEGACSKYVDFENLLEKNNIDRKQQIMEILEKNCKKINESMYQKILLSKAARQEAAIDAERTAKRRAEEAQIIIEKLKTLQMTTSFSFDGYKITKYHAVISASTVLGTGALSEIAASMSDLFGTTSSAFERKMDQAKISAQNKLKIMAYEKFSANAIIGIDFDYLTLGDNMIAVSANGTAVTIEKCDV